MGFVRVTIITLLLGLVSVLVQGTLLKALFPAMVVPGLALVLVVFLAFHQTSIFGAFLAFLLGLELDLCSGLLLGPWSGAFVATYGIVALLSPRIFVESPAAVMVTVFVSSIISNLAYLLIVTQVRHSGLLLSWRVVSEAIFTAIVCVPLFAFFRWCFASSGGTSRRAGAHA